MRITLHSKEIGSWFWQVQRKSDKVVIFCILFVLYKDGQLITQSVGQLVSNDNNTDYHNIIISIIVSHPLTCLVSQSVRQAADRQSAVSQFIMQSVRQ